MSAVFPGDVNTLDQGHILQKLCPGGLSKVVRHLHMWRSKQVFTSTRGSPTQPTQEVGLQPKFTPSLARL